MARSTIRLYLLLSFLSEASIALLMGTYLFFLRSHGLSIEQVSLVNLGFHVAVCVCEVPTGIIADVWGRKASYIASCVLCAAGLFLYGVSATMLGFVIAEVLCGIGRTCASGAFDAWMVDRLKHFDYDEPLHTVFVLGGKISQATLIIGALLGAMIAEVDPTLPWFLGSGAMILSGCITWVAMKEEYRTGKTFTLRSVWKELRRVVVRSVCVIRRKKNKAIRFLFAMGFVLFFALQAPNMQWQPYFELFLPGSTEKDFGSVFAIMTSAMLLGTWLCNRVYRYITNPWIAIGVVQIVIALGIGLAGCGVTFLWAFGPFLLHEMARGMLDPIKKACLNGLLRSNVRATLQSFESMAFHVGGVLGLLVTGLIAQYGSIRLAWVFSASTLLLATVWLVRKQLRA